MKKETYQSQKAFAGEKKPSMKRRFVGHDYTKRGIYMLTMAVEGRRPIFGRVYGCSDEKRGYSQYAPHALHPKCNVTGGILEEECRQLMQDFFKGKRH